MLNTYVYVCIHVWYVYVYAHIWEFGKSLNDSQNSNNVTLLKEYAKVQFKYKVYASTSSITTIANIHLALTMHTQAHTIVNHRLTIIESQAHN